MVDGVASEGDDGMAAHRAVALVVHEHRSQVRPCTGERRRRLNSTTGQTVNSKTNKSRHRSDEI